MITKTKLILKKDTIINIIKLNNMKIIFQIIKITLNLIMTNKRITISNIQRNSKEIH